MVGAQYGANTREVTARVEAALEDLRPGPRPGRRGFAAGSVPAGELHHHRQCQRAPGARARRHSRRRRAVRLPVRLAHLRDLVGGDPALAHRRRGGAPGHGREPQHHDAGRPRHRHRRGGGRRGDRRRERGATPAREPAPRFARPGGEGGHRRHPGSPHRGRLRHLRRAAGVPAGAGPVRHRRQAVRPPRPRLHPRGGGLARRGAHRHSRSVDDAPHRAARDGYARPAGDALVARRLHPPPPGDQPRTAHRHRLRHPGDPGGRPPRRRSSAAPSCPT